MTLPLTRNSLLTLQKRAKQPVLFVKFDGIDTIFGTSSIIEQILVGMPDLFIGNDWVIGGSRLIGEQLDALVYQSDFGSTTSVIDFRLDPDKGRGESVSTMTLTFLDNKQNEVLGFLNQYEFLGRKCRVFMAPDSRDNVFPGDYVTVFRGIVDTIDLPVGGVVLNLSHPDQKKRQSIFPERKGKLNGSITNSQTTLTLTNADADSLASQFLQRINGPDGSPDTAFTGYVKIDNEIIQYSGFSGNQLTGLTRAALGTTAATHADAAEVSSIYRITDDALTLALKLMISGNPGNWVTGVEVTSFEYIDPSLSVPNTLFFLNVDLTEDYGVVVGDYITTTGSAFGANNVTLKQISEMTITDAGTYILISGVTFVTETTATSTCSFRSQFDSLPAGLGMSPDQIDVTTHKSIQTNFLSGAQYDFYLREGIDNAREFIEKQLYTPIACYSTPRNARSSVSYTVGPLPTSTIAVFDINNVKNANKLVKRRSLGRNFYNTIIYRYNPSIINGEPYLNGFVDIDSPSVSSIPVGTRPLIIESDGLRPAGVAIAETASGRRLDRYKMGADYFEGVKTTFEVGYAIEVGDLVILDGTSLKIADTVENTRTASARYYEVVNKKLDLQTGDCTFSLLDTAFSIDSRYALISPSSGVQGQIDPDSFLVGSSFSSVYGANEYLKWTRYGQVPVIVRNASYTVSETNVIDRWVGNRVFFQNNFTITVLPGFRMELDNYNTQNDTIKLLYGFVSAGSGVDFADGEPSYQMI